VPPTDAELAEIREQQAAEDRADQIQEDAAAWRSAQQPRATPPPAAPEESHLERAWREASEAERKRFLRRNKEKISVMLAPL
jgi:hypothetical protein